MKRNIRAALVAPALVAVVAAGAVGIVSAASATNDQVCGPLTSGKIDTTGDPQTVTVTLSAEDIAAGKVITGYCVKAGSANQEGGGPVYVTVDPPVTTITFGHPSGKAVSHYSYTVGTKTPETPTETPTTPTETPTTPTETPTTPTETPTVPTETPTETPSETPQPEPEQPEQPEPDKPGKPDKPDNTTVTECVDGVFVTTVNGEVISESGSCDESLKRATVYAQEEGL